MVTFQCPEDILPEPEDDITEENNQCNPVRDFVYILFLDLNVTLQLCQEGRARGYGGMVISVLFSTPSWRVKYICLDMRSSCKGLQGSFAN